MADIFISYAKEDRSRIIPLVQALEELDWNVWWDRTIPAGKTWREVIGEALENARSVIVAWSKTSVKSRWVQEEADWGLERKILIPIFIDDVRPPLGFGAVQAVDLSNWEPSKSSTEFEKLISDLSSILGPAPLKIKEAEQLRAEEEKRRKEQEEKERKAAEEERRKEQELKRKAEEERQKQEAEEKRKAEEMASPEPKSYEPHKTRKTLIFGTVGVVIVLLIVGIWWWISRQQVNEVRQEIEKISRQALDLENAVKELDKPEQYEELYRQRDTLIHQVEGISERATKVGMRSRLEQLQNRLERIQIELANKEKELIAARKGPISPQKTITNSIGMKFILIPEGKFVMGSRINPEEAAKRYGGLAEWYKDEQPQHSVKITKPFYLQTTEVSHGQWKKVMGNNPSDFKNCGDDCPVEQVSWNDAQEFIGKLNQLEDTNKYRLPTEAEWEYSCRAETETPFFTGECISTDQANYGGNYHGNNCPKGEYRKKTVKVGSFQPNAWGLYDMHGNVYEWVQDWYGDYPSNAVVDPKGHDKGRYRVLRGGSWRGMVWSDSAWSLRSANRIVSNPDSRDNDNGFRVARDF